MPVWAPPTPPQDENDLYIDYSLGFLYEQSLMPESQLPPVYIPKETNKRLKLDNTIARKQKVRKEEGFNIPRSLFDRPSTAIIKLRRELILQKLKGSLISGPESAAIHRTLNALGASCVLPQTNVMPSQALKPPQLFLSGLNQDSISNWAIHEDWAVLQVMQYFQDLPLNLLVLSPGHIPNWDLVSDVVNSISCNYRSAKLCKYHYEMSIIPREEGKVVTDANPKQKQKKVKGVTASPVTPAVTPAASSVSNVINKPIATTRPIRTSQLIVQDNNSSFSQICNQRFETIKQIANKRTPTLKPMFINPTGKNPKHIALLSESGINYEQPLTPIQVAINRAERILREKQKAEQQLAVRQQQLQIKQQQQQTPQIKAILAPNTNIPAAQHQLQQAISAKVAALNQATLSKVSTAAGIISNASATTSTQLNLTKALSQVSVASLTNQQQPQHSLPQPLLSQLNVNQQTIGSPNTSTSEAMSQGLQVSPQTCSVVSVATLTPQAHQKLMAAVSPAVTQIGSQTINRLTTNPHLYKQLILRQQQQQQLQQRQQQSQHIQIQSVPQTAKQIATIGVGQQQQKFQITATVSQQPVQQTQSLIASAGLKGSQPNIVTSIPVAVPMAVTQQQRISTTTATPVKQQQIISTRTVSADPLQIAQLLKQRQIVAQQPSGNLPQTQILLQQSATQSSQPQQILQNPVTFVKTLSSPTTLVTQSLTIPITMTGMNIFTSPATKVVSPTTAITSTTTALTSVPATQLRQIQLLQQKRAQQSPQLLQQQQQQQQIQTHLTQQLGQQSQQKVTTATIAAQTKGIAQLQTPTVGTFQILHQPSATSQSVQTAKHMPTSVTVQQIQQALKQGQLVVPHNLSHTIHVTQSPVTTSGATLIPQSLLQAVTQPKVSQASQLETTQTLQSTPIAVTQIAPNQQTIKHIQVVSTASPQTQTGVAPKSIIISGQPAQLIQTTALQHAVQSQPQTVTFAIRAATQTNPQTSPQTQQQTIGSRTITTTDDSASTSTSISPKEESIKTEQTETTNQSQQMRQSPYATRQRNNKDK